MKLCALVLFALLSLARGDGDVKPEPKAGCQYSFSFQSAGQQAYLRSPDWPNSYPNNADCKYSLSSPAGTKISMNCTEFNVEYTSGCNYDRMTVSLSGDSNLKDGTVVCGQGTFSRESTSNALVVGFKSDGSNPSSRSPFRFQCLLTVTGNAAPAPAPTQAPATTKAPEFSDPTCTCGFRNEGTRIVGGTNAGVNEFPWRVAMYTPRMGVFCGATVISPNYVMTAAHCTAPLKSGDTLYADIGDHDLTTTSEASNEVIKCKRIIQHTSYNNETQDNDISLCELEKPLTYGRTVQAACLPWTMGGQDFQGKTVTASGWGTTSSGGSASTVLKKVELPVKTTEECRKYYGSDMITDNMICTYSPGKDTCQGDSGGSIDYKEPNTSRYFAIGVVSWGVGCAGVNQPGVYAKVTNYLEWILANTNGESFCH